MSEKADNEPPRFLYVVNEAHFFLSHRLPMARAARSLGYEIHVAAPTDHVWAPANFNVRELTDAGFHYHPIPLVRRGQNPVEDLVTFAALWRLYRRVRPTLVHNMTIKPVIYGGLAARLLRVPAVVSLVTGLGHIFIADGVRAALLRRTVLEAYRQALRHSNARVVFQNPNDRDIFVDTGVAERAQTCVIRGSGVALDAFVPTDEPPTPITVILPARLIWEKGVAEFVAAARELRSRSSVLRFVLVGDTQASNPRSVPASQLEVWVDEGIIEWWGRCTDMPAVYAKAHIVCLPSRYGEGVPKALMEAAACSRPIVTTDIPGCREVVRHGENGLLVPPGDVDALISALATLSLEPALRRQFGQRARQIAVSQFSEESVERQTLAVYSELLGPP